MSPVVIPLAYMRSFFLEGLADAGLVPSQYLGLKSVLSISRTDTSTAFCCCSHCSCYLCLYYSCSHTCRNTICRLTPPPNHIPCNHQWSPWTDLRCHPRCRRLSFAAIYNFSVYMHFLPRCNFFWPYAKPPVWCFYSIPHRRFSQSLL